VLSVSVSVSMNRGLVGPVRQFGPTGNYQFFAYAMLIGAVAPIPFWLWQRRFPDTKLKFINLPVMLNGPTLAPPANGINYASWFIAGLIFRTYLLFCLFGGWFKSR
jgi:OPT oligopeptide transporter protein